MGLETPTLVHLLPLAVADALEDLAAETGTDAVTLATGILRRSLTPRAIWPVPLPRTVKEAVPIFLAQCEQATEPEIAAWIATGCGWSITHWTLKTVLSRLTTSGQIRRLGRRRYALAAVGVDKG